MTTVEEDETSEIDEMPIREEHKLSKNHSHLNKENNKSFTKKLSFQTNSIRRLDKSGKQTISRLKTPTQLNSIKRNLSFKGVPETRKLKYNQSVKKTKSINSTPLSIKKQYSINFVSYHQYLSNYKFQIPIELY